MELNILHCRQPCQTYRAPKENRVALLALDVHLQVEHTALQTSKPKKKTSRHIFVKLNKAVTQEFISTS